MKRVLTLTKLDSVKIISFKDTVLVPLKIDLFKLFGTNDIEFQIHIKENKIIIESPEITKALEIHEIHQPLEALNVS